TGSPSTNTKKPGSGVSTRLVVVALVGRGRSAGSRSFAGATAGRLSGRSGAPEIDSSELPSGRRNSPTITCAPSPTAESCITRRLSSPEATPLPACGVAASTDRCFTPFTSAESAGEGDDAPGRRRWGEPGCGDPEAAGRARSVSAGVGGVDAGG